MFVCVCVLAVAGHILGSLVLAAWVCVSSVEKCGLTSVCVCVSVENALCN